MMAKPLPVTERKEKLNRGKEAAIMVVLGRTGGEKQILVTTTYCFTALIHPQFLSGHLSGIQG